MKHKIKIEFTVESTQVEAQFIRDAVEQFAFEKAQGYRAGISARSRIESEMGRVADIEVALANPLDYELSFGCLGWQVQHVGESIATVISKEYAEKFIVALNKARE